MVPQQRREDAHAVPAQHQILRGIAAKAANVGAFVQEAAHIQGGHHVQRKQNVAPPRMVVASPDAAIPVHPDAGRTGVYQNALVRLQPLESLTCRTGHVITKKIMYLVVPHTPLFGVVVEQLIIVFVVGKLCHHAGKSTKAGNIQVLLAVFLNLSKLVLGSQPRTKPGQLHRGRPGRTPAARDALRL